MFIASRYAQRFVLFQGLYEASQGGGQRDWQQLVARLSQGQQLAERVQLEELAEKFASGQQLVMDELRDGGLFLDWELRFLQLGLAVGNLPNAYLRLAEHYRMVSDFALRFRRHLWLPLSLSLLCAFLLPLMLYLGGFLSAVSVLEVMGLSLLPGIVAAVLLTVFFKPPVSASITAIGFTLPKLKKALSCYHNYWFVGHLAECVGAGFPLQQSLRQASRRMPASPQKNRYLGLAGKVETGQPLSAALLQSGVLDGVGLQRLPAGIAAAEAPAHLGLAIHARCEVQLGFWSATLPYAVLVIVPWSVLLNAWFLGS